MNDSQPMRNYLISKTGQFSHGACILLILIISAIVYLNAINNGFVADDNEFVLKNSSIRSLSNLSRFFSDSNTLASKVPEWGTQIYRPLRTLSYATDYAIYGLNSTGFHLTSLILHILVTISLYALVTALFQKRIVALISAVLFSIHPVHVEAVSWIASRADLIGALFMFLTLFLYISFKKKHGPVSFLYLSVITSLLSYMGKESTIVLPALIILYDTFVHDKAPDSGQVKKPYLYWVIFAVVAVCYLIIRFSVTGRFDQEMQWWGGSIIANFLMMAKATALYMYLILFPFELKTHYILQPESSVFDLYVLLSFFIIITSFIVIAYSYKVNRKIFYLLIWFYVCLIPVSNIIPMTFSIMAERFLYMPSAGPIIALSYGLYSLLEKKKINAAIFYGIFLVISLLFSWKTVMQNKIYENEFVFYTVSIQNTPDSVPSYKGLADFYLKKRDYSNALNNYESAIALDQNYADAFMGKALTLNRINKNQEALASAKHALVLKPQNAEFWYNTGNILKDAGDLMNAVTYWEKAVELNPLHSGALNNLGNYYLVTKNPESAIRMYKSSLKANPFNAATYFNIAAAYESLGNTSQAREYHLLFIQKADEKYKDTVNILKNRYGLK